MMISKIKSFKLLPRETTSSSVAVQCEAKLIWQSHLGNAIVSKCTPVEHKMIWSSSPIVQYFLQTTKDIATTYQQWDVTKSYEQCVLYECGILAAQEQNKRFHLKRKEGQTVCNVQFLVLFLSCFNFFSIVICGSKRKGQDKQWLTNITNHRCGLTALVVTIISGRGVNEMTPVNATYEGSPRDISWAEVGQSYLPTTWKV